MVHHEKQYKFYNHNLSSLFQYLCISLVIKKLYEFEINILTDKLQTETSIQSTHVCESTQVTRW